MRVKCIGGEFDGELKDVPSELRHGDHYRLPKIAPLSVMPLNAPPPDFAEMAYHEYVLDGILGTDYSKDGRSVPYDMVRFLRPADWTSEKAIRHQFNK